MAVLIVNVTPDDRFGSGLQDYELRVNYRCLAKFTHVRQDGLAICLRKAADAFERSEQHSREREELELEFGVNR